MHTDAFNLRRGAALAAAATFAAGFALVGPFAGISHAAGCVSVISNNTSSYPYTAVVKNNCGYTVSARVDLQLANDTACKSIGPYGTASYTYRFGTVRDAVQC